MKKTLCVILVVLAVVAIALAAIPTTRDEIHWLWASKKDETRSYESYLRTWPAGRHAIEAKDIYDKRGWSDAQRSNTVQGFEQYLQAHLDGKHVTESRDKIESLHWTEATGANTVQGFERYLQAHPDGKHVTESSDNIESLHWTEATRANTFISLQHYLSQYSKGRFAADAKSKQAELLGDDAPFLEAQKKGTKNAFTIFLSQFPGHKRESDVRAVLKDMDGRDIVDLLKEGKIKAKSSGSGIKNVNLDLKLEVEYKIRVRIPVGTFFVCGGSAQNMITTREKTVDLDTDDWISVRVEVGCANRTRAIPRSKDEFSIERSPKQQELQKLIPLLKKANVSFAIRQAAIWIVTDDADYDDMGLLVSRSQFQMFGGSRVIKEVDCARAMEVCQEAGIDITNKSIWRDRNQIIQGLPDGRLKTWLQEEAKK